MEYLDITIFMDEFPNMAITDDDNLTTITVKRDVVFEWFKNNILESFRGDDQEVSNEGLFEEWQLVFLTMLMPRMP